MKQNYNPSSLGYNTYPKSNILFNLFFLVCIGFGYGQNLPISGSNTITSCSGNLYDSGGSGSNYSDNDSGYTIINPTAGNYVVLNGTITTESGYDFVYIYDGMGTGGVELWNGSGSQTIPTITSLTGSLTVLLSADVSITDSGINFTITCSTTPGTIPYCIPSSNNSAYYIDDFSTTGGLTNIANNNNGNWTTSIGYSDYTAQSVSQSAGGNIAFNIGFPSSNYEANIWVDWNNDGDFDDLGEQVYNSPGLANPITGNFNIPAATAVGNYRMRVRADWTRANVSSCGYDGRSEAEDYTLIVVALTPCTEPTAQATNLTFGTVTETSIAGSFTAASPAPDNYLILMNTTGVTPSPAPVDGNNYTIGSTVGGATVIDNDNNTNFTATGLSGSTTYYFFVYSFNDVCSGGPNYFISSPLNGNETTLNPPLIVPATGNNSFTLCSGNLYDNGGSTGNYANGSNGYTVLNPATPGNYIEISGTGYTESNFDFLYVYDGVGTTGTPIWSWENQGSGAFTIPTITSITGSLTVEFTSDGFLNYSGFDIAISCTTTPGTPIYCEPSVGFGYQDDDYIRRVDFIGTLNNTTNSSTYSNSPRGYQDFTGLSNISQQAQGGGINIYTELEIVLSSMFLKAWVDWNQDGNFDTSEIVYNTDNASVISTTFGFEIPISQAPGFYRVRIRANNTVGNYNFGPCGNINNWGETEDYLFEVIPYCPNTITNITNGEACGINQSVNLEFEGSTGTTGFNIYANETGGAPLTPAPTFTTPLGVPTGSWTSPTISSTTTYWVTAINGCESLVRTPIVAEISPTPTVTFTPANPIVCGEEAIQITAEGDLETAYLIDEDFEGSGLGSFSQMHYGSQAALTSWTKQSSTYVPSELVWWPAISSGFGTNHFVMSNSDINSSSDFSNELLSSNVDATDFLNLTLEFDMYYSDYYETDTGANLSALDYITIAVSTDGGTSWTTLEAHYDADVGVGTDFETRSIDLSMYAGNNSIILSFFYYSEGWTDGVAVDNIKLFGDRPLNTAFDYDTSTVDAFTDAACTTTYVPNTPATTIWVKPTLTQLENASFTIPVTTVLSNGCTANGSINVTNNTKIYRNAATDWNTASNWRPAGVPTLDNCVIIPDTNTSIINGTTHGEALNVSVRDGGDLTVQPDGNLTIVDFLEIEPTGGFVLEDNASLIQINDITNTGNGTVNRESATVISSDYVYWSSPVANYNIAGVPGNATYRWVPTIPGNGIGAHGNWAGASGPMVIGKGYIKRTGINGNAAASFTNIINNGTLTTQIQSGDYDLPATYIGLNPNKPSTREDDNWNLVGNPYPSALNADKFLAANTNIEGNVRVWTHGTPISPSGTEQFYEDYANNYSVSDYIVYNASGGSVRGFNGNIASGQGFMVLAEHVLGGTAPNNDVITFTNDMRYTATGPSTYNHYDNTQFYRTTPTNDIVEKHRIWLTLVSPSEQVYNTMVGYISNATMQKDRLYDATSTDLNAMNIFSLINDERMVIQGRALPFDENDQVPMGIITTEAGIHTIGINNVDGLFENDNQEIYLEDLELGIIHDLRANPYTFSAGVGRQDRFVLRYTNNTLNVETLENIADLNIIATPQFIKVTSGKSPIQSVVVYDILGRILANHNNIDALEYTLNSLKPTNGTLIVKATTVNGAEKTKKVVY